MTGVRLCHGLFVLWSAEAGLTLQITFSAENKRDAPAGGNLHIEDTRLVNIIQLRQPTLPVASM